ncbi:MAG: insulinase family protein, partial [Parvularculaceae bacterium]|nr:insulinase family protein [Parvularculaceae bacterium]
VVHEDRKAPVVAASVWYKVGSKDEPQGKSGFAHLFEHLMFNGSENYNDDWFKPLQEVGATGLNGTTNVDRTNYFQTVPTPALDRILWMESDRMGHLLGAIDMAKLNEQREVVKNEKRQGENQPYGRVFERILDGLFPANHPYEHTTIGSMADLDAASLDDVKNWFKQYYGAANAVLVLAGDIDAKSARPLVEKYFGWIPSGPPLTKWNSFVPQRSEATRETMYDRVPQARIYRLWVAPEDTSPTASDLTVAAYVLGDGKNSRLYKSLVYDKQIATDASVFNIEWQLASIVGVFVDVKPGADPAMVEAELDRQMAEFLAKGPTREEVSLVSTKIRSRTVKGLEEVGGFGGKAVTLAQGELVAGDPGYYKRELAEIAAANPAGVLAASKRWLGDNYHQITVLPFADYKASASDVNRKTGLPAVAGDATLTLPAIEESTLSNGVKLIVAKRSTIPVVNIGVMFDAGYAADAGGKLGLANFTTTMLEQGAGKFSALAYDNELARLGAEISASSSLDTTTVSLSALKENLQPSISLLADVVLRPTIAPEELERQRALILAGIKQEKSQPGAIAFRLLPPLMFGEGHAYGIPLTGSGKEDAVAAISRADIIGFKDKWMRPDLATIFVVGDTTTAEIKPALEKAFGSWRAKGPKPTKNIANVALPSSSRVILIDRPGSPQSFILAGNVAPSARAQNNVAIQALNEVLGGSFVSRINMNLREAKGWSYGARTALVAASGQSPFIIQAPVQTDKTGPSIAEIKKELAGILGTKPATAQELERVKLNNIRALPGRLETSNALLGSLSSSVRFSRPLNYPERLPGMYRALTTADLSAAAAEVVHPDKMIWVIIGDAAKIRAEVEAAGIGPVEVKKMTEL